MFCDKFQSVDELCECACDTDGFRSGVSPPWALRTVVCQRWGRCGRAVCRVRDLLAAVGIHFTKQQTLGSSLLKKSMVWAFSYMILIYFGLFRRKYSYSIFFDSTTRSVLTRSISIFSCIDQSPRNAVFAQPPMPARLQWRLLLRPETLLGFPGEH